jgi:4-diphosphocytidyl-2-C-methyl-D-erythritol kinase
LSGVPHYWGGGATSERGKIKFIMLLPEPLTLPSYAKINLTLAVGGVREDGFHAIDSIVTQISASDEITVTVRPGNGEIKLILKDKRPDAIATPPLPKGRENSAYLAAALFRERFLPDAKITIWVNLTKRLPAQAGLGAGSSNAATVLKILSHQFPGVATPEELLLLAAQIGSDVPLFLYDTSVRMRGRGEIIEPLSTPLPKRHGIVVRPLVGVPTGPAYAAWDAQFPDATLSSEAGNANILFNDFEKVVLAGWPEVGAAHQKVQEAGALQALLCGSGSSIFGLARDRAHAVMLAKTLAPFFPWLKVIETI